MWRKDRDGIVRINLCFENNDAQSLMNYVIQGWETWLRYLGNPGPSTRQALKVQFYKVPGQSQLPNCYPSPGIWYTALSNDCVVSKKLRNSDNVYASLGYQKFSSQPGRHVIVVGEQYQNKAYAIAHEFGHIFGLYHEHQCSDRYRHVYYVCKNVVGFAAALTRAEAAGYNGHMLCTSEDLAGMFAFHGRSSL